MDALLPADKRYTSHKFRRVGVRFHAHRLDYGEAVELCAFVRTMGGPKAAAWVFQWDNVGLAAHRALAKHLVDDELVAACTRENIEGLTRAEGIACMLAMRDGGWRKGQPCAPFKAALLDMRACGMTWPAIARETGLTVDQVRVMGIGRWAPKPLGVRVGGLVAPSIL